MDHLAVPQSRRATLTPTTPEAEVIDALMETMSWGSMEDQIAEAPPSPETAKRRSPRRSPRNRKSPKSPKGKKGGAGAAAAAAPPAVEFDDSMTFFEMMDAYAEARRNA
mmetsp:Transcript_26471/g.79532  ORF Transcript_26471/g.79532 Transcript_26471/m.79532 type:complete len:109 (-) Transcript_26471:284-610(-)